ncbi:TetR family transcriptional regulator C-terminal domain-containing protein [Flavobacterium sandaracinum]|uniref:TetR/AcrR family transcriptional regulator n=1 Tax=Flavobacterium sandaracinum TaxID=2541733 RepID=A0A4R5D7B8_9FLAO|nr:TetR family transcriptional regulator C-terminal domain-containing protein [Flavobacterium sandaracinum]TDE07770.1 TetR/AcrR family transcriptional regulator [Flavobacterium sandaracinum]
MATKKTTITKDKIVSMYMNYVLEHSEKPKSVYHFTKINDFSETEFYAFFGTIESIEKEIFKMFLEKTVDLLNKNKDYETYDMKSKLLSFYFTFFEILTANRSYVVMTLKEHNNQLKKLMQLSGLKNSFKNYLAEIISDDFRTQQEKLQNFQEKTFQETSWIQLLLALKFWIDDSSPAFEKTDIYIEKSVKASFELMNIVPLDSLIDFGKFIFKEKIYNK